MIRGVLVGCLLLALTACGSPTGPKSGPLNGKKVKDTAKCKQAEYVILRPGEHDTAPGEVGWNTAWSYLSRNCFTDDHQNS